MSDPDVDESSNSSHTGEKPMTSIRASDSRADDIANSIQRIYQNGFLTDLLISQGKAKVANIHSHILASLSSVFREALSDIVSSGYYQQQSGVVVVMPDFDAHSIRGFVTMLYKGRASGTSNQFSEYLSILSHFGIGVGDGVTFDVDSCDDPLSPLVNTNDAIDVVGDDDGGNRSGSPADNSMHVDDHFTQDFSLADMAEKTATTAADAAAIVAEYNENTAAAGSFKSNASKHSVKVLRCKFCDYVTTCSATLTFHTRNAHTDFQMHSSDRRFECPICPYVTKQEVSLKAHVRTHTGERPYSCSFCTSSFAQASALKSHMYKHTGEKPHKCVYCPYSSTTAGNLRIHIRTHTGERPYKCDICDYASTQPNPLKLHMMTHNKT